MSHHRCACAGLRLQDSWAERLRRGRRGAAWQNLRQGTNACVCRQRCILPNLLASAPAGPRPRPQAQASRPGLLRQPARARRRQEHGAAQQAPPQRAPAPAAAAAAAAALPRQAAHQRGAPRLPRASTAAPPPCVWPSSHRSSSRLCPSSIRKARRRRLTPRHHRWGSSQQLQASRLRVPPCRQSLQMVAVAPARRVQHPRWPALRRLQQQQLPPAKQWHTCLLLRSSRATFAPAATPAPALHPSQRPSKPRWQGQPVPRRPARQQRHLQQQQPAQRQRRRLGPSVPLRSATPPALQRCSPQVGKQMASGLAEPPQRSKEAPAAWPRPRRLRAARRRRRTPPALQCGPPALPSPLQGLPAGAAFGPALQLAQQTQQAQQAQAARRQHRSRRLRAGSSQTALRRRRRRRLRQGWTKQQGRCRWSRRRRSGKNGCCCCCCSCCCWAAAWAAAWALQASRNVGQGTKGMGRCRGSGWGRSRG